MTSTSFTVTPWEVKGEIDYEKIIKEFGVKRIDEPLMHRLSKLAPLHLFLRRKLFFAHRDLDVVLDEHEKGRKVVLYTGRGPSGHTHLGHLVPWIFTRWLQKAFKAKLYFQMTDDEKFLVKDLSLEQTTNYAKENALDLIALGFEPHDTKIIYDTEHIRELYPFALKIAKRTTFSTAKAVFGFDNSTNIGLSFFPALQAAVAFYAQQQVGMAGGEKAADAGKNVQCLIPCAIDQDPYWRIARDAAPYLGYQKPATILSKFLPGLSGPAGKMSASDAANAIYTTDKPEDARKKVMRAFTGGQPTIDEQRKKGGNPDICTVCQWLNLLFEEDDDVMQQRLKDYRAGKILDGENKKYLADKVVAFLEEHQRKREKARDVIEKYSLTA
ncbi:MAG: tryptophan--tRNA ligase [Candidatus Burarchaeum sp.]|nr:tryptophan--tRNA ligase [Candidatus Burarchaeum sp.]MDO8339276.1 tryptophan--tRNA ligase [Candidatus Burarchaeum sp.]